MHLSICVINTNHGGFGWLHRPMGPMRAVCLLDANAIATVAMACAHNQIILQFGNKENKQ